MTENIRKLVRPTVTWLVMLTLCVLAAYVIVKYCNAEMARDILIAFLTLVASLGGYWFGSRKTGS